MSLLGALEPLSGGGAVAEQPIVIFGGFLSFTSVYLGMRDVLIELARQRVSIVEMQSLDWLPGITPLGWMQPLRRLHQAVRQAVRHSRTGKVTIIGHSAGGVLARIYLSPEPFLRRTFCGLDYVDNLISLGSPHYNRHRWLHGGMMSHWTERRYPGAFFAPCVGYTSVAGKLTRGDRGGSIGARHAYSFYKGIGGDGQAWGDGLVPVESALLRGSRQIIMDGVGHFTGFGGPWYGAREIVPRLWNVLTAGEELQDG